MAQRDRHVLSAALLAWLAPQLAVASENSAIILPSVTPLDQCASCAPLHRPDAAAEQELFQTARTLNATLGEAVQDLGLTLGVSSREEPEGDYSDAAVAERAGENWVFSPRLTVVGGRITLKIVAVAPGSRVLLSRTELIDPNELEMHVAVMMRDIVLAGRRSPAAAPGANADEEAVVHEARSRGRAVLALNSAVLGGYVGYSLQRASGSLDARLTYPLIALGTGIGLGGSLIVADEWDVGVGDAWYLSAGMWWPTLSALLLATSYDEPEDNRFLFSLAGTATGIGLATLSLTFGGMPDGGAVLAHSGGAYGLVIGGLSELLFEGRTDVTPTRGMGYGAGIGVLAAGAAARLLPAPSPSRLMLVDLSIALGGLTGAAVGSPLVFGETESEARNRLWLGSVGLGFVTGGVVGFLVTGSQQGGDSQTSANVPAVWPVVTMHRANGGASPLAGLAGRF